MFRLAVVNPGKKRSKKRKAARHNVKRKVKNTIKKRKVNPIMKRKSRKHASNPIRKHTRRHTPGVSRGEDGRLYRGKPNRRHTRRHTRRNPSHAMTMPKFDIESSAITLAITATGFIGNSIIKGTISPLIPGYSSLTGMGIVIADSAVAVGIPFALAFVLPMLGIKKATAIRISTALGVGMLTNVIARVTSEVMSGQPIASRIQRQVPGMGSIVTNIPGAKSYGLAKGLKAGNISAKKIFSVMPSYVS